jgi:hypothetical protein
MRRSFVWAAAVTCPALALAVIMGCGGSATTEEGKGASDAKSGSKALTALEGEYTGTITGKVTYSGEKPNLEGETAKLQASMKEKDDAHCLKDNDVTEDEKSQYDWKIDGKGGVANVFVWITPPKGKHFKSDLKDLPKEVELTQPHCAFVPHCLVLCPKHYDDKGKLVATGQTLKIMSSQLMAHNTKVQDGFNEQLPEKSPPKVVEIDPSDKPIQIDCNVHTWMRAYVGSFNHPYATITKADGTYEIKNVPVDAEVNIVAWHEKAGFINEGKGKGMSIKLKGKVTQDFTVEAK